MSINAHICAYASNGQAEYAGTHWIAVGGGISAVSNMKNLANQIRTLRRAKGWNQAELADALGVTQSTVSRWEKDSMPDPAALIGLAELAGTPLQDFIGSDINAASLGPSLSIKGQVQAGVWADHWQWEPDDWKSYTGGGHVNAPDDRRFGLIVVGESMDEVYPPGTILDCVSIIGWSDEIKSGKRVIAVRKTYGGEYETTVKEYIEADGKRWLIPRSFNPAFQQPVDLANPGENIEEVQIVALVCGSYRPEA